MDLFDDDDVDLDAMLGVEPDEPEPEPPPGMRLDPRRRKVVCKHWLRGLCKKGDECTFLHQLDRDRMPECWFFSNFGECSNKDCIFLHLRPEDKVNECPWYARGFCKHGPRCRNRHTRKAPCTRFLAGFCPDGPRCELGHPKFELPLPKTGAAPRAYPPSVGQPPGRDLSNITCFRCWQQGHYANSCSNPRMPPPPGREQFVRTGPPQGRY